MPMYAAGATVERRYPGSDADSARRDAGPQIEAFLGAGWLIGGERWEPDRQQGAPIGDAIATGSIGYLAGDGGELVITFTASQPADLPVSLPAYTGSNPRQERLQGYATLQVVIGIIAVAIFLIFFMSVAGQMGRTGFGAPEPVFYGEELPSGFILETALP